MQHSRKHCFKRLRMFKQDNTCIHPDGTFALPHEGSGGQNPRARLLEIVPVGQPAHTDVVAKAAVEEDEVEIAKGFDDEIGVPRAAGAFGTCGGNAYDGLLFHRACCSAELVVFEYFQGSLRRGDEWALIAMSKPNISGKVAVFWSVSVESLSG